MKLTEAGTDMGQVSTTIQEIVINSLIMEVFINSIIAGIIIGILAAVILWITHGKH